VTRNATAALALAALGAQFLSGQTPGDTAWDATVKAIKAARGTAALDRRAQIAGAINVSTGGVPEKLFTDWVLSGRLRQLPSRKYIEEARTDKQLGATPASSGTTSLVSKGSAPSFLSFAVENGALTQTQSGTSMTFRGNAVGSLDVLTAKGYLESYDDDRQPVRFLRRLSYSFTLDTSRGETASGSGDSDSEKRKSIQDQLRTARQQLSMYSFRMDLLNRRDPRDRANYAAVEEFMQSAGRAVNEASVRALDTVTTDKRYVQWLRDASAELELAGESQVPYVLARWLDQLYELARSANPQVDRDLEDLSSAAEAFNAGRKGVLDKINKQLLVALEYVNDKQPQQKDLSTWRLIAEGPMGGRVDFTANAALRTEGLGRLRDWQTAAQADIPLGKAARCCRNEGAGNPVISFAALAQRLTKDTEIVFAGSRLDVEKGVIAIAQAKLTIPVKGSGVKIPLSISFANRTELIREKEVRANVGITFDFDALIAGFGR
jgi:hypothetical protein